MPNYVSPLSIRFMWHPSDEAKIKPFVDYCFSLLSRDLNQPFSRSINLPIFFLTALERGIPVQEIKSQSNKTLIFLFLGKEIVSDDEWVNYIKNNIPKTEDIISIPIAIDKTAFNLNDIFEDKNFIRSYEFKNYTKEYTFIAITHEIYRHALNETKKAEKGNGNALKLFLSHAKDESNGIEIAKALKKFIDNSPMQNFFDATDIAPGYNFEEEIIEHIKESTLIAIHSDSYSSRYWCQREILSAKEYDRPIITVDTLENFEDRSFPFASNVPVVHIKIDGELEKELIRILGATLLETVRFFYSKCLLNLCKEIGWIDKSTEVRSRPPEVSDIEKLLLKDERSIRYKHKFLVYPEPPLYSEELLFLTNLGINVSTPLTFNLCSLRNKNIGVSISDPIKEDLIRIGQDKSHLVHLSQDIARHLLTRGATIIYGGDLREDGFTKFIFNEAQALQARLHSNDIHIKNYIAWPIYKNDTDEVKQWKAEYRPVAQMLEIRPPIDISDLIADENSFLAPNCARNLFVWSRCLTEMRSKMINECDIRICVGGKHVGYKGRMPGVLEEIIIAAKMKRPLFLLGGFGGITASVCNLIESGNLPQEFTLEWQIQNNIGQELFDFISSRDKHYFDDYSLIRILKFETLHNGLNREENIKLFKTPFIDEALYLVLKGIKSIL